MLDPSGLCGRGETRCLRPAKPFIRAFVDPVGLCRGKVRTRQYPRYGLTAGRNFRPHGPKPRGPAKPHLIPAIENSSTLLENGDIAIRIGKACSCGCRK